MRWLVLLGLLLGIAACTKGEENVRKANVYFKSGDLDRAEAEYEAAAKADPKNAAAWEGLGNVAFERRTYDVAVERYRAAVGLDPKMGSARHKLAVALTTANRTAEAMTLLEETIALDPRDAFALNALGGLHQKKGDLAEAKELQVRAVAADGTFYAARYALGIILVDMGELDEADRQFSILVREGQKALGDYGYARIAAKKGDWMGAAKRLDAVIGGGVAHPEKIAADPVFADGWAEEPMRLVKAALDRAAGAETSTVVR